MNQKIRIGTRGSNLALKQANEVKRRLINAHPGLTEDDLEIIAIQTSGDKLLDRNLADIGGKGLFVKEIEEALFDNKVDLAVHSLKDMPAELPEGLIISAVLEREDPRDCFISHDLSSLDKLAKGATIGTSSSRRKAQLLDIRPDLNIINFRGNVDTRLSKLKSKVADATILAVAGLKRLGLSLEQYQILEIDQMLPAVCQGAIGIESNKDNQKITELVKAINHSESEICISAERAFLHALGADCSTPMAALAEIHGEEITIKALIAKPDGSIIHRTEKKGSIDQAKDLGRLAAEELLSVAEENFFNSCLVKP